MRLISAFSVFAFFYLNLHAQVEPKSIRVDLQPIVIENGKYYFGTKRTNFNALVIPLHAIDDQKVDQTIKNIHTIRDLNRLINTGLFVWIFSQIARDRQAAAINLRNNENIFLGVMLASFGMSISDRVLQRKAIREYNAILLRPKVFYLPSHNRNNGDLIF